MIKASYNYYNGHITFNTTNIISITISTSGKDHRRMEREAFPQIGMMKMLTIVTFMNATKAVNRKLEKYSGLCGVSTYYHYNNSAIL